MDLSRQALVQVRVPCETLYFALGVGWLGVERWQEEHWTSNQVRILGPACQEGRRRELRDGWS